jgi:hypothetical protein
LYAEYRAIGYSMSWSNVCVVVRFVGINVVFRTFRAVDQKRLESFEMWCWRRMEKISWTDHVRNEDVLLTVKE